MEITKATNHQIMSELLERVADGRLATAEAEGIGHFVATAQPSDRAWWRDLPAEDSEVLD